MGAQEKVWSILPRIWETSNVNSSPRHLSLLQPDYLPAYWSLYKDIKDSSTSILLKLVNFTPKSVLPLVFLQWVTPPLIPLHGQKQELSMHRKLCSVNQHLSTYYWAPDCSAKQIHCHCSTDFFLLSLIVYFKLEFILKGARDYFQIPSVILKNSKDKSVWVNCKRKRTYFRCETLK